MTIKDVLTARAEVLTSLVQEGRRLSIVTIASLKDIMAKMQALLAEEAPEEAAVAQAWAPAQELLLQDMVTGETLGGSYEELLERVRAALCADRQLGMGWKYPIATLPTRIFYTCEEWDPGKGQYQSLYYSADWEEDESGVHFANVEPVDVQKIAAPLSQALEDAEFLLEQAKVKGEYGSAAEASYSDPGYQADKKPRYPLKKDGAWDKKRIKAAWGYIHHEDNAAKYTADQLARIKGRIRAAAKKVGIELSADGANQEDAVTEPTLTGAETPCTPIGYVVSQGADKPPILLQQTKFAMSLCQQQGDGTVIWGGKATHGNVINTAGEVYPTSLWQSRMPQIQQAIAAGKMLGATWHPRNADGTARNPYPHEVSHKFTALKMQGDYMTFEAQTLPTGAGKDLAALLTSKVGLETSTRCTGTLKQGIWDGEQVKVVEDNEFFELHGIDVVLAGASPGSAVEYARLQAQAEPQKENKAMDPKEIEKMVNDAIAQSASTLGAQLQAQMDEAKKSLEQGHGGADELKSVMEQAKALLETNAARERVTQRDEKVNALIAGMVQASELPASFDGAATRMLQSWCETADAVEAKKPELLTIMAPFIEQHAEIASKGMFVREYNEDGTKIAKFQSVDEAIQDLVQGAITQGALVDNKRQDPTDTAHTMRMMLRHLHQEHPELGVGYVKLHNREIVTLEQSKDWLLSQDGYKHLAQAGETTTTDIAAAVPFVFPIVVQLFPQLIAWRYGTVQPMDKSTGRIYFEKIKDESDNAMDLPNAANFTGSYTNDPGEKETIKRLKYTITSEDISTEIKAVGYDVSVRVMRHLRTDFGVDVTGTLVSACADQIAREWNFQILADMIAGQTAGSLTYNTGIPSDSSFDGEQWRRHLMDYVQRARDYVYEKTEADGYVIIGEPRAISRITSLSKEVGSYTGGGLGKIASGVDIVGTLTTGEELVKVAWWRTLAPDKLLVMGRSSANYWPKTGYVIAPYLGLYVTPIWVDPQTNDVMQSMESEMARKMVNGDFFALLNIAAGAGTPL